MENLYSILELQSPTFIQRLFKKQPKENALIELNNLLAIKNLKEIQLEQIEEISARYKVDFHKSFLGQLKELYERYLKRCFDDNLLTKEEIEELSHLKHILILQDNEINELHSQLGGDIYKKAYEEAISNGTLEGSKKEFIDKLQSNLQLPDNIVQKISSESRSHFMDIQLGKIISDGRISPDEWEELNLIAKNLKIDLQIDVGTKEKLEKMKLYWLIENGDLPLKQIDINLQKSEKCFFTINAEWLENRTVTQRINYGGVGYRVKIMKGVYYRAGSVKVQRITSEQQVMIDSGNIYVTNKRIIFVGNKKNANIQLSKVLSITPYSDGVGIEKDSGKSPIFRVSNNADIFALVLGRMINDLQTE